MEADNFEDELLFAAGSHHSRLTSFFILHRRRANHQEALSGVGFSHSNNRLLGERVPSIAIGPPIFMLQLRDQTRVAFSKISNII